MTLLLPFAILLVGAALCFGLSRAAPTRVLGVLAAAAGLAAGGSLLAAPLPPPDAAPQALLTLGEAVFSVSAGLGPAERAIAAALLGGGGTALLALAGAIAGPVRGFGALFGWSLLSLAAALLSLAAPPLSLAQPFAWSVLAIAGYGALRSSGAEGGDEAPPAGLTLGLLASASLTAALLMAAPDVAAGSAPGALAAALGLFAALGLAGAPPLLAGRADGVAGPAPLGALIFGLCGPAAALGWLLRITAALPGLPAGWSTALGLIGGLGALACGAGALGERGLRPLLALSSGAQAALVVMAAGLAGPLAALAGPGLLVASMLAAVTLACAAVSFERIAGSDDYTLAAATAPPRIVGAIWALGAAASLGLPPLFGFWGRLWLLEAALEQQPWLVAAALAGAVLLALALTLPLAGLWASGAAARARATWSDWLPATLSLLAPLLLGAAPGLAWAPWLRGITFAPPALPVAPPAQITAIVAGLALLALAALIVRAPTARADVSEAGGQRLRDPDEDLVRLPPQAAGEALRPLTWLASPAPLLQALWGGLQRSSEGLRFAIMLFFEQRFYLLGVLAVLLTIMLLMAQ